MSTSRPADSRSKIKQEKGRKGVKLYFVVFCLISRANVVRDATILQGLIKAGRNRRTKDFSFSPVLLFDLAGEGCPLKERSNKQYG
jgi:hypothetical protein